MRRIMPFLRMIRTPCVKPPPRQGPGAGRFWHKGRGNKWKIGLQNVKDAFINLVEETISILFTCPQFDGLVRA